MSILDPKPLTRTAADDIYVDKTTAATTYAGVGSGNIQATARKLSDAYGDVTFQFLGDSTIAQWYPGLLDRIKTLYPHRSIRTYTWDDVAKAYGAPVTYFTGTGTTWVNVYDGSKGGTIWEFAYLNANAKFGAIQPDCTVIGYGLNQGNTATATARLVYRQEWQRLAAVVKAQAPNADLLLVSQNPRIDAGYELDLATNRAQAVRSVAAEMGAAYGPVTEAYLTNGPATYLNADGIHPNTAGKNLYGSTLAPLFKVQPNMQPSARTVSPLLTTGTEVGTNGDFAEFPGELTGWTRVNCDIAKDTTTYESTNGYAVKITANAAAQSRIEQTIPVNRVKGRWLTVAARMWIPAGQSNVTGRTEISTTGGTAPVGIQSPGTQNTIRDCWIWEYVSAYIPADSATVKIKVVAGATTEATAQVIVDRVFVGTGNQPHDVAVRPTPIAALSPGLRKFRPARWYTTDPHTVGTATVTAGWAFCHPFYVPVSQAFTAIAAEITTAAVGATLQVGVYSADTYDQPSALMFTAGTIDASTTGVKELAITQTLTPGWYWIGTLALGANIGVRSLAGPSHPQILTAQNTLSAAPNAYLATAQTDLPATWTATAAAAGPPKVALKTAA